MPRFASPPPAKRRAAPARRSDEGSESGGDAWSDEDDAPHSASGPRPLGEGERATESCFWHEPAPCPPASSLAAQRFTPLHAGGRGAGARAREDPLFVRAREAAHDAHVAAIRGEVAQLTAQTNGDVFSGVVDFLRACPPAEGRVPLAIVATRCNAHDEQLALSQLGAHVRSAGLTRFVVHLRAPDCPNVHAAVRAIAVALLDAPAFAGAGARAGPAGGAGSGTGGPPARPNGCASHDLRILRRWWAAHARGAPPPSGGAPGASIEADEAEGAPPLEDDDARERSARAGAEPIVVVIADADLLSAEALDDLIYACAGAPSALPLALIAGVATSADRLIGLLPRSSLSRVRTTRFRLQPALSSFDEAVRRIFLGAGLRGARGALAAGGSSAPAPARMLGVQLSARAFELVCEQFLAESLSLGACAHTLSLSSYLHFSTEPLAFLAAAAPSSAAECAALARHLAPFHLECARALPSVRAALNAAAAPAAVDAAPAGPARAALGDDELRAQVGAWLWQLHCHQRIFQAAMLALADGLAGLAGTPVVRLAHGGADAARAEQPAAGGAVGSGERPPAEGAGAGAGALKPLRWQLSLRELLCAALEDGAGLDRLSAHLCAELGAESRAPALGALGGLAALATGSAALAGGRGPRGLIAFADGVLGALDGAESAAGAVASAAALARARDALHAARELARALLEPAAAPTPAAPADAAAAGAQPPARVQSAQERARAQQHWSAGKRRQEALAAATMRTQPAQSDSERAAAAAARAMGEAADILVRGCLRPLCAHPLGEIASGSAGCEARLLRKWCAPRVREAVEEGLASLAAPPMASASAAPRAQPGASPTAGARAPTAARAAAAVTGVAARPSRGAPASAAVAGMRGAEGAAAPAGRPALRARGPAVGGAGGMLGMGAAQSDAEVLAALAAAGASPLAAPAEAPATRRAAPPRLPAAARAAPPRAAAIAAKAAPKPTLALVPAVALTTPASGPNPAAARAVHAAIPDMPIAHAYFAGAQQRALNLADWYGDFCRRLDQMRAGLGADAVLARTEPQPRGQGGKRRKNAEVRRGDAKRKRLGHGDAARATGAHSRKRAAAVASSDAGSDGSDVEDVEDEGALPTGAALAAHSGSLQQAPAADPALLARFVGVVGSMHAHGLVRASARHPGHVIKMVFCP